MMDAPRPPVGQKPGKPIESQAASENHPIQSGPVAGPERDDRKSGEILPSNPSLKHGGRPGENHGELKRYDGCLPQPV